ncbi:hypothetical protein Pint_30679 [Pistacia integerrima]|uniref:Uncharacterized protein n=1 Tax=Pistacia integerrima TaxID=434235 RepID=A0ACC0X1C0_9ROSI|nr:hypothetical protein Pint_30679 [Pistacia integerrima]
MDETESVPVPPDELRCYRCDDKGLRCHGWRLHEKPLCQSHFLNGTSSVELEIQVNREGNLACQEKSDHEENNNNDETRKSLNANRTIMLKLSQLEGGQEASYEEQTSNINKQRYPKMSENDMEDACPFCRENCNCTACLRRTKTGTGNIDMPTNEKEKSQHLMYLVHLLYPFFQKFYWLEPSEIKIQAAMCKNDERLYCNNCETSIVDYHRSCPKCSYDLCLSCCQEIRNGCLQGGHKMTTKHVNRGKGYLHGGEPVLLPLVKKKSSNNQTRLISRKRKRLIAEWKVNEHGDIPCPVEKLGGCGYERLELKCLFSNRWLSKLKKKVKKLMKIHKLIDELQSSKNSSLCSTLGGEIDSCNKKLRKAASREGSVANFLYCPSVDDIQQQGLEHFKYHWVRGEPIIVTNSLELTSGLSWEPMVMSRIFCAILHAKGSSNKVLKTIDCLDGCKVCSIRSF